MAKRYLVYANTIMKLKNIVTKFIKMTFIENIFHI